MLNRKKLILGIALACAAGTAQAELSANISMANNYLWRGLTQSINEPAISGGIDYAHESGLYVGTWVSNVSYVNANGADTTGDSFGYEHDLYIGYGGEYNGISYDFGYLYYNYDDDAKFDFGEIYGSVGYMGFSVTAYLLANTEADETAGVGKDGGNYNLGFGSTYYISGDYGIEVGNGIELGAHIGYHNGDFVDAFNFAAGQFAYWDYALSVSKGGFSLMVSDTDLGDSGTLPAGLNNDDPKWVVSYSMDFEL